MPDRRGATLLEDLPEEIIDNILVRLPSNDVGRCRAVSTSWRSATSTPEFMLRHHRRQPSLPLVKRWRMPVVIYAAGASSQEKLWPFLPGAKYRYSIDLRGACDGLLAVSLRSQFYVCNPVIRTHALLPQPQPCHDTMGFGQEQDVQNDIVGFYLHHLTGEHRVLWISQHLSKHFSLYVLTVGCDRPRLVGGSSPSTEHNLLRVFHLSGNHPVAHRGNLHWHPYDAGHMTDMDGQIITVFDGEAESLRWMRCPAQVSHNINLFSVEGAFACAGSSGRSFTDIHVWAMQDYEAEIWAFKYRIDVAQLEASRRLCLTSFKNEKGTPIDFPVKFFSHMAMLNERELLIMFDGGHLLRCDADGNFLGMVNISRRIFPSMWLTEDRLQESIIPIPCNKMQEEDEEDPFSP